MPSISIRLSQDAAITLGLARTAVPFAGTAEDEAERWVRVMRMHGHVGRAMQALGMGEAPLESPAVPRAVRLLRDSDPEARLVDRVEERARELAAERRAQLVSTVDIFFAVLDVYSGTFERALYARGVTRLELIEELCRDGFPVPAPYGGALS
ncbi:MAG TPA: hypothetical protein VFL87_01575 [Thermoleophilaceae bacterium]|nr:hypothetical protein [Thermoleophilaceae bacterium]